MSAYTEAQREQAALICAIAASNPTWHEDYEGICDALGLDVRSAAFCLAYSAWQACEWPFVDAEAEALIRTGWES